MKIEDIAERMKGQDTRATKYPVYCVQTLRKVYGVGREWTDRFIYLDSLDGDGECETEEEANKNCEEFEKVGVSEYWKTVQIFFSENGAEAYIEANSHNLTEPRIYVDTACRNDEMLAIIEHLQDECSK